MSRDGETQRRPDPAFGRDAVAGPWRTAQAGGQAPGRRHAPGRWIFVWLLALLPCGFAVVVFVQGRWWQALAVAAGILVLIAIVLALVMLALWRPWARRYPARPVGEAAQVRLFQFVTLGTLGGFNGCVEIASDGDHVHLSLMPPFSWPFGAPISLPRGGMTLVKHQRRPFDAAIIRLDDRTVTLPAWCVPEFG